jgi:lipopolysaccharide/colanic/teichoic acid biosynthesis glycosyltransferase
MMLKRAFDLLVSGTALVLIAPILLAIGLAIRLDSRGPAFFRQERVGRFGRTFRIHKFRSMTVDAPARGPQLTVGGDARVTRVGGFLRRHKLDELPQLIDVFMGNMSVVGPRPEVPRYVALYSPEDRDLVLSVRPGITDWASVEFKDESEILGAASDPEAAYRTDILPRKLAYYRAYVRERSFGGDICIIFATLKALLIRGR